MWGIIPGDTKWNCNTLILKHMISTLFGKLKKFGFVALFSSAFPLASLCAFLNNILEIRRDANKYTQVRFQLDAS